MKTIHWYEIGVYEGWQVISLPEGAEPVMYQGTINGKLWCVVDTDEPLVPTKIAIIGTGWKIPEGGTYVCSTLTPTGFVWHVFKEVLEIEEYDEVPSGCTECGGECQGHPDYPDGDANTDYGIDIPKDLR